LSTHPRSVRGIAADIEHAHYQLRRSVAAVWVLALVIGGEWAVWLAWGADAPRRAAAVVSASGLAAGLAFGALRARTGAAAALAAVGVGAAAWLAVAGAHPFYWLLGLAHGAAGAAAFWWSHRLRRYYIELIRAWTPRSAQRGEVYTVRDGAEFAVVKVLAVEPGQVHVRQYAMRYPDRPWHVKSSTLLRPEAERGAGAFPHLPLGEVEFARWEPVLLRAEPVTESELRALNAWNRVQGGEAGPPRAAG
jgi:hypothetical protein